MQEKERECLVPEAKGEREKGGMNKEARKKERSQKEDSLYDAIYHMINCQ